MFDLFFHENLISNNYYIDTMEANDILSLTNSNFTNSSISINMFIIKCSLGFRNTWKWYEASLKQGISDKCSKDRTSDQIPDKSSANIT